MSAGGPLRLFLCGDVMTGRGIDQVLPSPGNPTLREFSVRDARDYVRLAETASGPIARPVGYEYVWGDALAELDRARVDLRIINLETSITTSSRFWPGKAVHYRMHPGNVGCLAAARIDCCCLANNHMLDLGREGLLQTLDVLDQARIARAGAGRDLAEAAAPAVLDAGGKGRVLVFSIGSETSGIPEEWAATKSLSGVNMLGDLDVRTARELAASLTRDRRPDDVVVASIHWGGNWGYSISDREVSFARALVEGGVDIVHGHSSHHVKGLEVYRDRPIIYGCGDFLSDYEGIGGYEEYRGDLSLMYLIDLLPDSGRLAGFRLVPMRTRRLRLERARGGDTRFLLDVINRQGRPFDTQARLQADGTITVYSLPGQDA